MKEKKYLGLGPDRLMNWCSDDRPQWIVIDCCRLPVITLSSSPAWALECSALIAGLPCAMRRAVPVSCFHETRVHDGSLSRIVVYLSPWCSRKLLNTIRLGEWGSLYSIPGPGPRAPMGPRASHPWHWLAQIEKRAFFYYLSAYLGVFGSRD
jgi:hypothetical protein